MNVTAGGIKGIDYHCSTYHSPSFWITTNPWIFAFIIHKVFEGKNQTPLFPYEDDVDKLAGQINL